jgi:transketolase
MEPFVVPDEAVAPWREAGAKGAALQAEWQARHDAWKAAFPELAAEFERRQKGELPKDWEGKLTQFTAETGNVASRAASGVVLNAVAASFPEFIGGSADLAESTLTHIKGAPSFGPPGEPTPETSYAGRNFHYGIREHGMGAVMNGMALHGGIVPYGATFLIFSDYMRPAIRLAALMHRHVVYVFTHDSIGLGEDGPTHQPIEQLTALRCIPNLTVLRPADASETAQAWRAALAHKQGPVALVLTRQKLAFVDRAKFASAEGVSRGAYALNDVADPQVVLMGSGSEVELALKAGDALAGEGIRARVVSVPSMELFAQQDAGYRDAVLPPDVPRVAIEAAHPMSWQKLLGARGVAIGIERFGASAPYQRVYTELGITAERMAEVARGLVGRA